MNKLKQYKNHYIIPYEKHPNRTGGICDEKGNMVIESIRGNGIWGKENKYWRSLNDMETIKEPTIFLGHLTKHYGHFLWETLSRFWIFIELNKSFLNDKQFVFMDFCHNCCNINEYIVLNYIMETLNIQNYSFNKVTRVKKYSNLYIPEVMNIGFFGYPKTKINAELQQKLFYSITKNIVTTFDNLCIYITRKDRCNGRSSFYDNLFKNLGFKIIDPISKTFKKDLEYYKSAKIIAGIDGTGLHNVGFMQHPKRYMIELKHRKNGLPENNGLTNGQYYFNWFNNVPYTSIPCFKLSCNEVEEELNKVLNKITS